jgi:hypothetical protein
MSYSEIASKYDNELDNLKKELKATRAEMGTILLAFGKLLGRWAT